MKIIILGAGESGTGAALLAQNQGYEIIVSSKDPIKAQYKSELTNHAINYEEGGHTLDLIRNAQLIVKSPGVPDSIDIIQQAQAKKIEVISEIEFAFRHLSGKIIAISGTNGKTTTASLTYHLLKTAGINATLAGNIGESLSRKIIKNKYDWYVVEVSSFQLDGIKQFKPNISILLNITSDHLDRYEYIFDNYVDAKFRLIQNLAANDYFIYCADDTNINKALSLTNIKPQQLGISLQQNAKTNISFDGTNMHFLCEGKQLCIAWEHTTLTGSHNLINTMASIAAAWLAGVETDYIEKGLRTFKNVPHRMESITKIREVEFVNDSKATNVHATLCALRSYDCPLIWIAGGVDKGNNYTWISELVREKVKLLLCLGRENEKLQNHFSGIVPEIKKDTDIKKLVRMALEVANKGDVVLLSPACASFDLFENYEDRGDQFREAVLELKEEIEKKPSEV